ncbi:hypothetical protein C4K14_5377 [Pseudomonas chlororaphis subsp. aureofaciens]|nr:hypothetical protein C4K14_5377 [Pseudomonas chlororaphis subsp. aureofaciens]
MVVNDDAVYPKHRGALGFIASKLAPTGEVNAFRSITNFSPLPTTV